MDDISGSGSSGSDCITLDCTPSPTVTASPNDSNSLILALSVTFAVILALLVLLIATILITLFIAHKYCDITTKRRREIKRASKYSSKKSERAIEAPVTPPLSPPALIKDDSPQGTLLLPRQMTRRASLQIMSSTVKSNHPRFSSPQDIASLPYEERIKILQFSHSKICLLNELYETNLGKVYRGEGLTLLTADTTTAVLVKSLRERANSHLRDAFNEELKLLSSCCHPNILTLLAVATIEEPLYMVYELMEFGTLKDFLQSTVGVWLDMEVESTVGGTMSAGDLETVASSTHQFMGLEEMVAIAIQVIEGMEYLSNQGIVHKDLTARNCQVGEGLTVKISNFGFSYDIHCTDYTQLPVDHTHPVDHTSPHTMVPLRWLAPEVLQDHTYSTQSDVWAFGVLLWEVFSFGADPYPGLMMDSEVIDYVLSYCTLSQPDNCSRSVYRIMKRCWDPLPNGRPSFGELKISMRSSVSATFDLESVSKRFSTLLPSTPDVHRKLLSL